MKLELPDENINELQRRSIIRLIDRLKHAHMTDVVIQSRINAEDKVFEADWLKHLKFAEE
jgi:hypothetical protein